MNLYIMTFYSEFIQSDAKKDDYLGEYTGELISQREADKRGKIYDIVNLSFLFDLNDKVRRIEESNLRYFREESIFGYQNLRDAPSYKIMNKIS